MRPHELVIGILLASLGVAFVGFVAVISQQMSSPSEAEIEAAMALVTVENSSVPGYQMMFDGRTLGVAIGAEEPQSVTPRDGNVSVNTSSLSILDHTDMEDGDVPPRVLELNYVNLDPEGVTETYIESRIPGTIQDEGTAELGGLAGQHYKFEFQDGTTGELYALQYSEVSYHEIIVHDREQAAPILATISFDTNYPEGL